MTISYSSYRHSCILIIIMYSGACLCLGKKSVVAAMTLKLLKLFGYDWKLLNYLLQVISESTVLVFPFLVNFSIEGSYQFKKNSGVKLLLFQGIYLQWDQPTKNWTFAFTWGWPPQLGLNPSTTSDQIVIESVYWLDDLAMQMNRFLMYYSVT